MEYCMWGSLERLYAIELAPASIKGRLQYRQLYRDLLIGQTLPNELTHRSPEVHSQMTKTWTW
jgi:hypothetical protein